MTGIGRCFQETPWKRAHEPANKFSQRLGLSFSVPRPGTTTSQLCPSSWDDIGYKIKAVGPISAKLQWPVSLILMTLANIWLAPRIQSQRGFEVCEVITFYVVFNPEFITQTATPTPKHTHSTIPSVRQKSHREMIGHRTRRQKGKGGCASKQA